MFIIISHVVKDHYTIFILLIKITFVFCAHMQIYVPIAVAAPSEAWTVFACSNTGVVGSNRTRSMDGYVRLFCVCVVLWADPPSKESYRLRTRIRLRNWKAVKTQQMAVDR
jgi:hypothetical protein